MNRAIVLMYHNIGTPPAGENSLGLYVSPAMFRFQMWYLKAAGFRVVPLRDIANVVHGKFSGKKIVAITFDDGYQDYFESAYPVLRAYGFPSTVFVVTDLVGRKNEWDFRELKDSKKLMDWDTIRQLKKEGVTFGSHSKTHPFLSRLSSDELRAELNGSRKDLETHLHAPVDFFCYPYGDYDNGTVEAVKQAGYRLAVTTKRGLVHEGNDPFRVRRSFIRSKTNPFLFLLRLHTSYEDRKRAIA